MDQRLQGLTTSPFLDTNVLVYSVAKNDARSEIAEALLAEGGVVSVQVFNEFAATARGKLGMSWVEITEVLDAIRVLCPSPLAVSIDTHDAAVKIARTHGFQCAIRRSVARKSLTGRDGVMVRPDFQQLEPTGPVAAAG